MSILSYPFWSKNDGRVRALWRILLQIGIWLVLTFILIIPAGFIVGFMSGGIMPAWFNSISVLFVLIAMIISLYLMARYIDHRPIQDYGLELNNQWWADLLFGLILGVVLMASIFLLEMSLGWLTITDTFYVRNGSSFLTSIMFAVMMFVCVGIYEELLSRGYHMRNFAEGLRFLNPRVALIMAWIISSLVFGVLHAANPGASIISTVNITLAGLLLGLPVLLTGRLGLAIGLHITWNFAQGNIFGFPVSGLTNEVTFIAIEQSGPDLWTGGAFGPEAGLMGVFAMIFGAILIVLWVRWQDKHLSLYDRYAEYHPPRKTHN